MWMEYEGRSIFGIGLMKYAEWEDKMFQSAREMRSHELRPLTVAKSNGPWMYVSVWVRLTHRRKGMRCCLRAKSSDVSDGLMR